MKINDTNNIRICVTGLHRCFMNVYSCTRIADCRAFKHRSEKIYKFGLKMEKTRFHCVIFHLAWTMDNLNGAKLKKTHDHRFAVRISVWRVQDTQEKLCLAHFFLLNYFFPHSVSVVVVVFLLLLLLFPHDNVNLRKRWAYTLTERLVSRHSNEHKHKQNGL